MSTPKQYVIGPELVLSNVSSLASIPTGILAITKKGLVQQVGVDARPTAGSKKLITSGGLYALLNQPAGTVAYGLFSSASSGIVPASGGGTVNFLRADGTWASPITAISVASTNGFAGVVSNPIITLSTTVTGVIKGDGSSLLPATSGVDYSTGTSALATGILKSTTGTGVLSIAIAGDFPTLNQNTTGSAAVLTSGRTITITGDVSYVSPSFDGSANISAASTVAWTNGYTTYDARYLALSGGAMTGFLTLNAVPTSALHAATKSYVDGLISGLSWKDSVVCRTTADIALSGEQTINGILTSSSRVLVMNQTIQSQNGIYVSSSGAWSRSSDALVGSDLVGATVLVTSGTLYPNTQWTCNVTPITVGVTSITFVQVSGAGTYSSGTGLSLSANVFSVAANGITYSLLQQVAAASLVGNPTGSLANAQEITLGSTLAFSGTSITSIAMSGDITSPVNSFVTTIASHAVSNAKFRQSLGLSVVGNSTSATANVADITGVANQVLRVSGTVLGFGSINLASSTTVGSSILSIANGGTGKSTATTAFNALAPSQTGNSGKVLTTNGTNTSWTAISSYLGALFTATAPLDLTAGVFSFPTWPTNAVGSLTNDGAGVLSWASIGSYTETDPIVAAINGIVKSDGTTISAAVSSTDYAPPTPSGGALLKANGTGGFSNASGGIDYIPPYSSQPANYFLATPNGSSGTPSFRSVVAADIPTLNQNTTGSSAKWTTARSLAGNSVDGSVNVAFSNKFIVQGTSDAGLSGAQFLGALGTGLVKNTTTTGVLSIASAGVDYESPITAGTTAQYWRGDKSWQSLNAAVIASVLTGYVSVAGTVSSSDSVLSAIQKLNGNIGLLTGAIIYQGLWNASTNTSPTLVSGVGIKGYLYKVSVAGTTSIDGISQWNIGDSIVFDGTTWDKLDGIATEVTSVFGRVGPVTGAAADYSGVAMTGISSLNGLVITPNTGVVTTGTWNASIIGSAYGGTGIDSSALTGVAQLAAGVWSVSTALANGTTATTQAAGNNSTSIATTAYADAIGFYWKTVQGTPVRSSDTVFTITDTGNANLYNKLIGRLTVLKWTDTTTKMAMVVSATYSSNTVTVTIIGDTLASSATMSTFKYCVEKVRFAVLAIAGTLATGNDLTGRFFAHSDLKLFGADGHHGNSGTTNATTYSISKNSISGASSILAADISIASGATAGDSYTASDGTTMTLDDYLTVNCTAVSTTAPVDAYITIFFFPLNSQYLT